MPSSQLPENSPASVAGGTVNSSTGAPTEAENQSSPLFSSILRMLVMFFLMQWFFSGKRSTSPVLDSSQQAGSPSSQLNPLQSGSDAMNLRPKFLLGSLLSAEFYLSESDEFHFSQNLEPTFAVPLFKFGDWNMGPNQNGKFVQDITIPPSTSLLNNGSLWAHIFIFAADSNPNPLHPSFQNSSVIHRKVKLNIHRKRIPTPEVGNLMQGNLLSGRKRTPAEELEKKQKSQEIVSYWYPYLHVSIVPDLPVGPNMQQFQKYFHIHVEDNIVDPPIYFGEFWHVASQLTPLNSSVQTLPLEIQLNFMSLNWYVIYQQVDHQWKSQSEMGLTAEEEIYNLKDALLDNHPAFLAITFAVSILHSVFDILAFKNDIQFWKNRKSYVGLSIRTIFLNIFFQFIILLYLYDNDTSLLILVSTAVGLVIEVWKIKKALITTVNYDQRYFGVIPSVSFEDRYENMAETKEYDDQAFKYLSWVLYPALFCYSIYSLVYFEHKGFYSWIISSLVGAVYTFGFIMMTPQLFINYKLKSVAHLPWRMMTYKALNTFVDDLFAFVIKMPTLHRLACFRDDIVFFIYLYQKWIYPVDYNRCNEFEGTGFKDDTVTENSIKSIEPGSLPEQKKNQ